MSTLTKILIALGATILIGMLGYMIYNQEKIKSQQALIQSSIVAQQTLVDGIVRSQSQYATAADLAKFAADNDLNMKAIQANMQTLNSQLSSINVITTISTGQNTTNVPTTTVGPKNPTPPPPTVQVACTGSTATCPNQDPNGYQKAQQNLALNEDFTSLKVPIGTVGFSAWQANPWDVQIAPREYNVDTVVGTDENQKQTFYNKFTVKVNNKDYDIPIKTATTEQVLPKSTFSFWNPRLLVGMDGGIDVNAVKGAFIPSVNLGIMSYGQYKTTPTLSVLEVGIGVDVVAKTPELVITPVAFNFGNQFFHPLMNNTYIAPSVSVGTTGNITVGAGLRVGF
jgi:hypothetical protein